MVMGFVHRDFVTYYVGKLPHIEVLFLQNIRQHVMVLNYIACVQTLLSTRE